MAKAPCARLTKIIRPSVIDKPTPTTNCNMPSARPSNRTRPTGPSRFKGVDADYGAARVAAVIGKSRCARRCSSVLALKPVARPAPRKRRGGARRLGAQASSLLGFARVFDRRDFVELDVDQMVAAFFDLADVDVLDDVTGFRVDGHWPARAFPFEPFHRLDGFGAVSE